MVGLGKRSNNTLLDMQKGDIISGILIPVDTTE